MSSCNLSTMHTKRTVDRSSESFVQSVNLILCSKLVNVEMKVLLGQWIVVLILNSSYVQSNCT